MAKANELLPFKCSHAYRTSGTLGNFDWKVWKIFINMTVFSKRRDISTLGDLKQEEVAQMVDTIYHEARHSEQFFRIAQMRAGEGKSAETIVRNLSIPLEVAQAAVKSPLKENETNKA